MDLRIAEDDLSGPEVAALLRFHLDEMYRMFPPESVHTLPIERLRDGGVTFFAAWQGERLAGCGALKEIDARHGEVKSMRTAPGFLRQGIGAAILARLIEEARKRGYARISLETGSTPDLLPARRLYEAQGFRTCPPFGDYPKDDPLSTFMTLEL